MDPTHILSDDYEPNNSTNFKPSWAKRKGYGKLYGKNYMDDYKAELELMFEQGKVISSQKMNAAKMREQLCNKYPYKFSIPSETEIKNSLDPSFRSKKILAQLMMIRTIRISEAEGLVQNLCGLLYWSLWW